MTGAYLLRFNNLIKCVTIIKYNRVIGNCEAIHVDLCKYQHNISNYKPFIGLCFRNVMELTFI